MDRLAVGVRNPTKLEAVEGIRSGIISKKDSLHFRQNFFDRYLNNLQCKGAISGWWFVPRDDFSLQPALARGMREGIIDIGPTYIVLLHQLDDEQVICSRRKASNLLCACSR